MNPPQVGFGQGMGDRLSISQSDTVNPKGSTADNPIAQGLFINKGSGYPPKIISEADS